MAFELSDQTICERMKGEETEKRLNEYRDFLAAAEVEYNKFLIRINSEDSRDNVFLNFCDAIENSV